MRTKMLTMVLVFVLALIVSQGQAEPMGKEFTYQGRLIDANYPADGLYDFQFKLYDDPSAGMQWGDTIDINELDVIDGYVTVLLDFNDPNVLNGDARWLGIGVRPGDMNDPNEYTVLSPRQEVTPAPYAIYAQKTGALEASGDLVLNSQSGNVEVGSLVNPAIMHFFGPWRMYSTSGGGGGTAPPGIYPTEFDGNSYGTPSEIEWDFGDGEKNATTMTFFTSAGSGNRIGLCPDGREVLVGTPNKSVDVNVCGAVFVHPPSNGGGGIAPPGIYPTEFTGSGMWSDKDVAGIATGVSQDMALMPGSNKCGIGTTNPQGLLQVGEPFIVVSNPSPVGPEESVGISDSDDPEYTPDAKLEISRGGTGRDLLMLSSTADGDGDLVIVKNDGKVGIGTASPARKLHVNDVIRLEPRGTFPANPDDGDLCVKGDPNDRHIYCYLNGDWRQLD